MKRVGIYGSPIERELYNALKDRVGDVFADLPSDFVKQALAYEDKLGDCPTALNISMTDRDAEALHKYAEELQTNPSAMFRKLIRALTDADVKLCLEKILAQAKLNSLETALAILSEVLKIYQEA